MALVEKTFICSHSLWVNWEMGDRQLLLFHQQQKTGLIIFNICFDIDFLSIQKYWTYAMKITSYSEQLIHLCFYCNDILSNGWYVVLVFARRKNNDTSKAIEFKRDNFVIKIRRQNNLNLYIYVDVNFDKIGIYQPR